MRSATKFTSIVAAVGAGALGVGLIGYGTGVGANFVDSVTGQATATVGDFSCDMTSNSSDVTITQDANGNDYAHITLDQIDGSKSGSTTKRVTIENTGDIALAVQWTVTTNGSIFDSGAVSAMPVAQDVKISKGHHHPYDLGVKWTTLGNADLGTTGTVTYKATCTEAAATSHPNVAFAPYVGHNGQYAGTFAWNNGKLDVHGDGSALLTNVSPTLPTDQPTFTSSYTQPGLPTPEIDIYFTNGDHLEGTVAPGGYTWQLVGSVPPAPRLGTNSWTDATSGITGWSVSSARLQFNGPVKSYTISCLNYDNHNYVGSGTCSP